MAGNGKRGFGSMDAEKQRAIASKGGRAAHERGRAHEFSSAEASAAGRKGGEAVKEKYGPRYYAEIGRKGGEAVSHDRNHMAGIGRLGGEARGNHRTTRP